MKALKPFIKQLSTDPDYLKRYKEDPKKAMESASLSAEEQDILLSGDPVRIRSAIQEPGAEGAVVVVVVIAVIK